MIGRGLVGSTGTRILIAGECAAIASYLNSMARRPAIHPADALRKIAVFFSCRLAKLVHLPAQQSVIGLVGDGAGKVTR